jgi:L-asparagine oxygenase
MAPLLHNPAAPHELVDTSAQEWDALLQVAADHGVRAPADDAMAARAADARSLLPPSALAALGSLRAGDGPRSVVLRGLPVPADLGPSPQVADGRARSGGGSELLLLAAAAVLGEPIGYLPEQGGALVQHLAPTQAELRRQTSNSSAVRLELHTETAFHPHHPTFLLLSCLRDDPEAATLISAVDDVVDHLPAATVEVLGQARFRCGVDESFGSPVGVLGPPVPVLTRPEGRWCLRYDADLMVGTDDEAADALEALREEVLRHQRAVTLRAGELLAIDNRRCVHGRSAYAARFDGTDRWLLRSMVIEDLAAVGDERVGRIITTHDFT